MKKLLETLYITTPESYLFERNGNICISIGGAEKAAVPITQVNSIVL
jgi:CRISPR/Cas system-associated endonuclease Cas1